MLSRGYKSESFSKRPCRKLIFVPHNRAAELPFYRHRWRCYSVVYKAYPSCTYGMSVDSWPMKFRRDGDALTNAESTYPRCDTRKTGGRNNFHMIMTSMHKGRMTLTPRDWTPIPVYSADSEFAKLTRACIETCMLLLLTRLLICVNSNYNSAIRERVASVEDSLKIKLSCKIFLLM